MTKLRRWLYRRGLRWHAQFNWFAGDGETGQGYRELLEINPSWHFALANRLGMAVEIGGGDSDRELQFYAGTPIGSFWLTFDGLPQRLTDRILPGYWINSKFRPGKLKI